MVSRADMYRKNAERSPVKQKTDKKSRNKRQDDRKQDLDEMDKEINRLKRLNNLDEFTTEKITQNDGSAEFIAEYFVDKQMLNTNQLRDIHASIKKIDQLEKNWDEIKLYYNLFVLDIQLKYEKNVIPKKFYNLIKALTNIIDKIQNDKDKVQNFDKVILLIESIVGYHKYYDSKPKTDKLLYEEISKINSEYLLNINKNDDHVKDVENIALKLIKKDETITIYQMRKIFNEYKYMERNLSDWNNIKDMFYMFYPKLAYIMGRKLIPYSFYNLLIRCMNVIENGDDKEKILKFKNFILYLEAIISFATYENKKYKLQMGDNNV